jgi:hypothetical protein
MLDECFHSIVDLDVLGVYRGSELLKSFLGESIL